MKKAFAMTLLLVFLFGLTTALAETWTCAYCGKESEGNFLPVLWGEEAEECYLSRLRCSVQSRYGI